AATVTRPWQVDRLREAFGSDRLLVGVVAPGDSEAAAGFVKGSNDALGPITDVVAASVLLRGRKPTGEPAGDLAELLDANLHVNTTVARAALPSLRRRGRGRLVFAALPAPADELSVTCRASLAAIAAYADGLARELADGALHVALVPPATDPDPSAWL
ncbi:MAG: hypothetical protein KAI24_23255, partial [Planctomycetes bacterium]|nr:hypothetical protein [Planctomycetota bacterium]